MTITVTSLSPRDSFGMILVSLEVSQRRAETVDGGTMEVFVPATDSLSEARQLALVSLRQLAQDILDAPALESGEDVRADTLDDLTEASVKKFFDLSLGGDPDRQT